MADPTDDDLRPSAPTASAPAPNVTRTAMTMVDQPGARPPFPPPASRVTSPTLTRFIEAMDGFVYTLVGLFFLVAALVSLAYGVSKFFVSLYGAYMAYVHNQAIGAGDTATIIINFVSDLLLTLIIMEVLGTVVHYLQTRATSLKPFLFIGIISATRGILAVGARLSVTDFSQLHGGEFNSSMIELGVNAGVIIALGVALRLIGNFLDDDSNVARRDAARSTSDAPGAADASGTNDH